MLKHFRTATIFAGLMVVVIVLWWLFQKQHDGRLRKDDPAVLAYGYGPEPNPHVRYQPDVVFIGGGPKAIRGVSDNNLTWTIDGGAKGADQLSVGKVMFATSRAVGRVVAIRRREKVLAVTLSPVQLTEIIRDADLNVTTALKPDEVVYHESIPTEKKNVALHPETNPVLRAAVWQRSRHRPRFRRVGGPTKKMTAKLKLGDWEVEPYFKYKGVSGMSDDDIQASYGNSPNPSGGQQPDPNNFTKPTSEPQQNGSTGQLELGREEDRVEEIGLKVMYNLGGGGGKLKMGDDPNSRFYGGKVSNGVKFGGSVRLSGENIKIRSHIVIADGSVQGPSTFVVDGIDRLHVGLLGGSEGVGDNLKARIEVPAEFTQQIPPGYTYGVPVTVQVKFKFIVETAFSGGNSTLWTHGDYRISGPIGYENGNPITPSMEVEHPMMDDLHGIPIGVSGMVIAVEVRWLVGLGTEVAMMGPYGKLIFASGVTKGSVLAMQLGGLKGGPTCRSVTVKGDLGYGMGIIVDTSWFGKLGGGNSHPDDPVGQLAGQFLQDWKKTELELFESSFTFTPDSWSKGFFAPDIPLCRPGGSQ